MTPEQIQEHISNAVHLIYELVLNASDGDGGMGTLRDAYLLETIGRTEALPDTKDGQEDEAYYAALSTFTMWICAKAASEGISLVGNDSAG